MQAEKDRRPQRQQGNLPGPEAQRGARAQSPGINLPPNQPGGEALRKPDGRPDSTEKSRRGQGRWPPEREIPVAEIMGYDPGRRDLHQKGEADESDERQKLGTATMIAAWVSQILEDTSPFRSPRSRCVRLGRNHDG